MRQLLPSKTICRQSRWRQSQLTPKMTSTSSPLASFLKHLVHPIEALEASSMLHFCPHKTGRAKYERYREAWCLLKCPPQARGMSLVWAGITPDHLRSIVVPYESQGAASQPLESHAHQFACQAKQARNFQEGRLMPA